ncbi:MAG: ABC transporter permease [Clostridiales bacterium]|nr:ABC transporter permease [Clostridiales bacterium]
MHLFKHFFKMVSKNNGNIFLYSMIFIIMIGVLIFNAGEGQGYGATTVTDEAYKIGYIDNSKSELSTALIRYMSQHNDMIDLESQSEDSIKTYVFFTVVNTAVTIDEDFVTKVENGNSSAITFSTAADASPSAYLIESMFNTYLSTYETYKAMGYSASEAIEKTDENLSISVNSSVYSGEVDNGRDDEGQLLVVSYIMKFFIYICFSMLCLCVGMVIIKDNDPIVRSRVKVAPVRSISISLTNTAGLIICGIVIWAVISVVLYAYGHDLAMIREHGAACVLVLLATAICNCALVSFICSFDIEWKALPMICNIAGLAMSFLCGVFVPQPVMNPTVVNISKFLPFYWSVRVFDAVNPGSGSRLQFTPQVMWTSVLMLLLFAAVFTVGGIVVRKTQTYSKVR